MNDTCGGGSVAVVVAEKKPKKVNMTMNTITIMNMTTAEMNYKFIIIMQ